MQEELGLNMYDLGFRNYMPDIGRFAVIDPMTDFVNYQSPYVFSNNSPIVNIDADGLGIFNVIGNLFKRLVGAIGSIGNDCSCNKYTQESVKGAWDRADFPKINEFFNNLFEKKTTNYTRPFEGKEVEPISIGGIVIDNDFKIEIPNIIIPKTETVIAKKDVEPTIPIIGKKAIFTLNTKVAFKVQTTELINMSDRTIRQLIKTLVDYPQLLVTISVNVTANGGNWNSMAGIDGGEGTLNVLQSKRANAIRRYFINRGVKPSQISTRRGIIQDEGSPTTSFTIKNKLK